MKGMLYPLIGFLFLTSTLYEGLSAYPVLALVTSGLLACTLIGVFYVGLPLGLIIRLTRSSKRFGMNKWIMLLLVGIIADFIGQVFSSTLLLMISTSLTVLLMITVSAGLTASTIAGASRSHSRADERLS
jgi:FtsH-binding integral membrane protein